MLHDLTNPELYSLACEWLRGDDLSEESLQTLKVRHSIETEDAAKNFLANFGRISTETQPIVLCFDQLDNIPRLPNGFIDLQALFNINTTIHNDHLKNFLIIISIITNTWKENSDRINLTEEVRIDKQIHLNRINLDQAEALCASRLQPLHSQAKPQPNFKIFPLTRQALEQKFLGGKTHPRNVLDLGRQEYQSYKKTLTSHQPPVIDASKETDTSTQTDVADAQFQLIWQDEYNKVRGKITKITLLAPPELIRMLQEALAALQVPEIKPKLLSGRFTNYSLSYQQPGQGERVGVAWTEDPNMRSFFNVMNACHRVISSNLCQTLYLLRAAGVGNSRLVGNQIYRQIFTGTRHRHINPALSSVHYLAAYHSLVNAALASELVVAGKTISLKELEALICKSKILHKCTLLQNLGIVSPQKNEPDNGNGKDEVHPVKEFLLNLVITQQFMGRLTLIRNTRNQFFQVDESEIEHLIHQLCQEKKIQIINPSDKPEAQTICLLLSR